MKAIALKDPWASLVRDGRKTVETRTWRTTHRGPLLIVCSRRPASPWAGLAIAVVKLVEVRPLVPADRAAACLSPEESLAGQWAWILEDVRLVTPFPVKGRLKLFDVDIPKRQEGANRGA